MHINHMLKLVDKTKGVVYNKDVVKEENSLSTN